MSRKSIVLLITITVISGAIVTAFLIGTDEPKRAEDVNENVQISEKVTDECTEDYEAEQVALKETEKVDSEEEKISPNCLLVLKKHYEDCDHSISEYAEIPPECVNLSKREIEEQYPDWEVESFASNEVVLMKDKKGECGEHYILREKDGKIAIYKISGEEENLVEETSISIEYLTETDKINIQNGLRVNGKEELNQVLEDFE